MEYDLFLITLCLWMCSLMPLIIYRNSNSDMIKFQSCLSSSLVLSSLILLIFDGIYKITLHNCLKRGCVMDLDFCVWTAEGSSELCLSTAGFAAFQSITNSQMM